MHLNAKCLPKCVCAHHESTLPSSTCSPLAVGKQERDAYKHGDGLIGPASTALNSDPPPLNAHDYMVSKTLGGLHRVAVNLTLAATPLDLQAILAALQGNATRAFDSSALSGGAALPVGTLFDRGGPARVDPLAPRGGLLKQLASSGAHVAHPSPLCVTGCGLNETQRVTCINTRMSSAQLAVA